MFKGLIGTIVGVFLDNFVTEENYHSTADEVLDFFERLAAKTDNEIDDRVVAKVREILGIPDGDD